MKQYLLTGLILVMSASVSSQTELICAARAGDTHQFKKVLEEKIQEFACNGEQIFESLSPHYEKFRTTLGVVSNELAPILSPEDEGQISFVIREKLSSSSGVQSLITAIDEYVELSDEVDWLRKSLTIIAKSMKNEKWLARHKKDILCKKAMCAAISFQLGLEEQGTSLGNYLNQDSYHEPRLVAYLNVACEEDRRTVLHWVAETMPHKAEKLIYFGAGLHVEDKNGETPLQILMRKNNKESLGDPSVKQFASLLKKIDSEHRSKRMNSFLNSGSANQRRVMGEMQESVGRAMASGKFDGCAQQ